MIQMTAEKKMLNFRWKDSIIKENNEDYSSNVRIDHDRLYKVLIETFFKDFIQLFFQDVYEMIDFSHVKFLPQEVITDLFRGEKRIIDILIETRLKGERAVLLVHVENQSYFQLKFNERMFIYYSRLYEKYRCKIVPIAVFSHGKKRDESDRFEITFPFKQVLNFSFYKLELHKRNWRDYIRLDNPLAAALLSQMGYSEEERVQVKVEFLRMFSQLKLDPARAKMIIGFFEQYLTLSDEEENELKKEIEKLDKHEADAIFRIETSWERKGRLEGKLEEKIEIAKRMLSKGLRIEEIAEITELSVEEIKKHC